MQILRKHWQRISFSLIPLVLALLYAGGVLPIDLLDRLDNVIYDLRLRSTLPQTLDKRIVIVDIDERSLSELGHWPWGRDQLAALTDELFERQQVALVGFDIFFTEPDESSGLKQLQELARHELRGQAGFEDQVRRLQPELDYDARFARALRGRPVVLGYYFSDGPESRVSGVLPAPVMEQRQLLGRAIHFTRWSGYGANIPELANAAPLAGQANYVPDGDGVTRSIPLVTEHQGRYYEALSLAMYRMLVGMPTVAPGFAREPYFQHGYPHLESIELHLGDRKSAIPVDSRVAALVPYRGRGGATAGSFKYVSATDLLHHRIPAHTLHDKVILVGTTAPGLVDLRVTPVGEAYPGVEAHANLLSGLLDQNMPVKPDYAAGVEFVQLLGVGLLLAIVLPLLSAARAVALSAAAITTLLGFNLWAYLAGALVLPLASALVMVAAIFVLNMSYGYFVESRSKRELAHLFGTYVPPELVDEMVKDPDAYSMQAVNRELTVMFCDMRGFTQMSESMEPTRLQALLNTVFSRLTQCIRNHRGTIDKYMGDCVMAFWGAPVAELNHAALAVNAALDMARTVRAIKLEQQGAEAVPIGIGIGLNSGTMCVGDMGSDIRRSYTVIGDAVNLGSRLEALSKVYGVDIVSGESTRQLAPEFVWQELDRVRVQGKSQAVSIFTPLCQLQRQTQEQASELEIWAAALQAYRRQEWEACDMHLLNLQRLNAKKYLYRLYAARVSLRKSTPSDPAWDGTTHFNNK